ncbi:MAG: hypothetical protein JXA72_12960 [Bacteroidales bacterium]|nr:hypothetical protein [Bacteroidales bacterium]
MTTVYIYLRSVKADGREALALFDSNRCGAIDNLVTEVPSGTKIIWRPDSCSGIKTIVAIRSKSGKGNIFASEPKKKLLCRGLVLQLAKTATGEEAYYIEYISSQGEKMRIDPYIKIKPPEDHQ